MKVLYKAEEFQTAGGSYQVLCNDLVGTGRNWSEPARILGIHPADFIILLRNEYNANIDAYRKDGSLSWVGYSWSNLADARKYKNMINKRAREKNYKI